MLARGVMGIQRQADAPPQGIRILVVAQFLGKTAAQGRLARGQFGAALTFRQMGDHSGGILVVQFAIQNFRNGMPYGVAGYRLCVVFQLGLLSQPGILGRMARLCFVLSGTRVRGS